MKTFITFIALLGLLQFNSQAQVEFGASLGTTFANLHEEQIDGDMISGESKAGITAGIFANIHIYKTIYFQPSLNYVQRRFNDKNQENGSSYQVRVNLHYIELPLTLLYKTNNVGENFFFGFGPTVSMGLSGKAKATIENVKISNNIEFGTDPLKDHLQPLDIAGHIMTGIEFKSGIAIATSYNFGFSNLTPGDNDRDDLKLKSSYWGIRLGYTINSRRR